MRTALVQANTARQARKLAPWAARVAKVCGGYKCFESVQDWATWKNQR
jgi:hypothetical protein